jgi:uncharacterized membrane protein HdeD (DUF308 family)
MKAVIEELADDVSGRWAVLPVSPIWLIAFGVAVLALGGLAFFSIVTATIVSVYFVAIGMIVAGALEIALGLRSTSSGQKMTWLLVGALYVAAGCFALFNPLLAAGVLTLLLGASLVAAGLVRFLISFQMRAGSQWWWTAASAAVTTLLGALVLAQWPASSLYILGVFLSVDLLAAGLAWVLVGVAAMSAADLPGTPGTAASTS